MKRTWLFGLVLSAHAVAALVLFQGCRTVGPLTSAPSESTLTPAPPEATAGRPLPSPRSVTPRAIPSVPRITPTYSSPTTTYVVQKGDTLSGVAYRYKLNQRDIIALNEIDDPSKIWVGMELKLPGKVNLGAGRKAPNPTAVAVTAGGSRYVVKKGDTLSGIASAHGVKTADLRKVNNLASDMIRIDQTLVIPKRGSVGTPTVTPPAPGGGTVTPPAGMPAIDSGPVPPAPVGGADTVAPPVTPPAGAAGTGAVKPPVPPPAPPAGVAAANYQTHIVKEGETLTEIAIQWTASPSGLRQLNGLTSDELTAGQKLLIPLD